MLPDFPNIKRKHREAVNEYLQAQVRQDPLLSEIREKRHFEGNRFSSIAVAGESTKSTYRKVSSQYSIRREDVIAKGTMAFIENIPNVAEEIKKQKAKLLFDRLNEVTAQTGNRVDAKGGPLTFELFMELLEKIVIEFDGHGNPILPTLIISPEMGAKLKHKLPEWDANPECKKRFDEIIERKRKEWNDRESDRKLVD